MSDPTDTNPDPGDGGPRKSFWQHLDDMRQALLRSAMAVGLALVLCLCFCDKIVAILEWPLQRIYAFDKPQPSVSFALGETKFGPYPVTREQFAALPEGTAPHAMFRVGTATVGGAQVLTLQLEPPNGEPPPLPVKLRNFGPAEGFMVAFTIALYASLVLAAPFCFYFIGGFVLPAFHVREKRMIFTWLRWGVLLFMTGVAMTYFLLLPLALRASMEYSHLLGFAADEWRADEYIGFACKFMIGMGLGFQFPLVVLGLVKFGILDHRQLSHYRRHVIVVSFVLGAVLTTPEVITQVAMAVPLCLLYEACIWIAWYWERKAQRAEATDA